MKKLILAFLLLTSTAWASPPSDFAAGAMFGNPYGVTSKYWLKTNQAIDASFGYTFNKFFLFESSYLFHFPDAFKSAGFLKELNPYLGVGGDVFFATNTARADGKLYVDDNADDDPTNDSGTMGLAVKIPVGFEWSPGKLGYFVEAAPAFGFVPKSFFFFGFDVGARYYF
jgi:hypothetical protein